MREKKKIKTEEEIEIVFCEKCGKEIGEKHCSGWNICNVCERDICHDCWKDESAVMEFIIPCPFCREIGKSYWEKMEEIWKKAEEFKEKYWKIKTEWGKESKRSGK